MNRLHLPVLFALVAAAFLAPPPARAAEQPEAARVEAAADVLEKIMEIPEKAIPPALLVNAHGIAVVPGVIKVGFVVGAQFGRGVLAVRRADGRWSDPVFVTLAGGSVGWQVGAQSTDFVIVFKTRRSVEGIMKGKFTLGADAAVSAGPVGRRAEAATDAQLAAEIYSYSRSRGLFAGVSLEGCAIQIDGPTAAAFYGKKGIAPKEIAEGKSPASPPAAQRLRKVLEKHAGGS